MAYLNAVHLKDRNGKDLVLRSPEPYEAANLLDAMKIVMRESAHLLTESDEFNYTVEQEADLLRTYLDHPDKIWIVPVIEGRISGGLNFSPGSRRRNSHHGSFGISLLPDCCGRGIGLLMMEAFLGWAQDNPRLECVRLQVHSRNERALFLYRKLGFIEEGREIRGVKFSDGTYDDVIFMAKDV